MSVDIEQALPCPHCEDGGDVQLVRWVDGQTPPKASWSIRCRACRSYKLRPAATEEQALIDWNTWPRWRRKFAGVKNAKERELLDDRIRNQRARIRWLEDSIHIHAHAAKRKLVPGLTAYVVRSQIIGQRKGLKAAIEIAKDYALDAQPDSEYALACRDLVEALEDVVRNLPEERRNV